MILRFAIIYAIVWAMAAGIGAFFDESRSLSPGGFALLGGIMGGLVGAAFAGAYKIIFWRYPG